MTAKKPFNEYKSDVRPEFDELINQFKQKHPKYFAHPDALAAFMRMRQAAAKGFINATDCADYLVKKGMAFRDAYHITGKLVALCIEKQTVLEALPLSEYQQLSELFTADIYEAIDLITCVNERNVIGGPAKLAVEKQIKEALAAL